MVGGVLPDNWRKILLLNKLPNEQRKLQQQQQQQQQQRPPNAGDPYQADSVLIEVLYFGLLSLLLLLLVSALALANYLRKKERKLLEGAGQLLDDQANCKSLDCLCGPASAAANQTLDELRLANSNHQMSSSSLLVNKSDLLLNNATRQQQQQSKWTGSMSGSVGDNNIHDDNSNNGTRQFRELTNLTCLGTTAASSGANYANSHSIGSILAARRTVDKFRLAPPLEQSHHGCRPHHHHHHHHHPHLQHPLGQPPPGLPPDATTIGATQSPPKPLIHKDLYKAGNQVAGGSLSRTKSLLQGKLAPTRAALAADNSQAGEDDDGARDEKQDHNGALLEPDSNLDSDDDSGTTSDSKTLNQGLRWPYGQPLTGGGALGPSSSQNHYPASRDDSSIQYGHEPLTNAFEGTISANRFANRQLRNQPQQQLLRPPTAHRVQPQHLLGGTFAPGGCLCNLGSIDSLANLPKASPRSSPVARNLHDKYNHLAKSCSPHYTIPKMTSTYAIRGTSKRQTRPKSSASSG